MSYEPHDRALRAIAEAEAKRKRKRKLWEKRGRRMIENSEVIQRAESEGKAVVITENGLTRVRMSGLLAWELGSRLEETANQNEGPEDVVEFRIWEDGELEVDSIRGRNSITS